MLSFVSLIKLAVLRGHPGIGTFPAGIAGPILDLAYPHRFRQEVAVSLTGGEAGRNNLLGQGIDHLIETCEYLIEIRGLDEWRG